MKQYYYFVSSLPDLRLGQDKLAWSTADFIVAAREQLDAEDRSIFDLATLSFDFTLIEERYGEGIRTEKREYPLLTPDAELWTLHYQELLACKSHFVAQWAQFDATLRNAQAAWNSRRYGYDADTQVLPVGPYADAMRRSTATDFGMADALPWLNDLVPLVQAARWIDSEQKVDALRFAFFDTSLANEFFGVDRLIGYAFQLAIVERWTKLLGRTDHDAFNQQLAALCRDTSFLSSFEVGARR